MIVGSCDRTNTTRSHIINSRNARENGVKQGSSPALRQDKCWASAPEGLTSAAKAALPTMLHAAGLITPARENRAVRGPRLKACSTLLTLR